jgi:hypothetical protein
MESRLNGSYKKLARIRLRSSTRILQPVRAMGGEKTTQYRPGLITKAEYKCLLRIAVSCIIQYLTGINVYILLAQIIKWENF